MQSRDHGERKVPCFVVRHRRIACRRTRRWCPFLPSVAIPDPGVCEILSGQAVVPTEENHLLPSLIIGHAGAFPWIGQAARWSFLRPVRSVPRPKIIQIRSGGYSDAAEEQDFLSR